MNDTKKRSPEQLYSLLYLLTGLFLVSLTVNCILLCGIL